MATKTFDLAVKTATKSDGKANWLNIGAVWEGDKGPYLQLYAWFNPAAVERKEGSDSILVSMFPPKAKSDNA